MERSKKIQIGLLALIALLLVAHLFTGGFQTWFGGGASEREKMREAAGSMGRITDGPMTKPGANNAGMVNPAGQGNIPGTNVTTPAEQQPSGPATTIKYEQETYDFGVVDEGEVVKHLFRFQNTGKEPLVISNAKGSCGCTVPTWPKEPVPAGGYAEIKVEFNTKGKPGRQSKRVTVTANTVPTETFIEVTGEVRAKEQPAAKSGGH